MKSIFINLPVKNLDNTIEFFTKLGFSFNQKFTSETATCMIIEENIYAMLLVESYFKTFIKKEIADAKKVTEVLLALSFNSIEEVDEFMQKGIQAGGVEAREKQELGFMYSRALEDLDGHTWEVFWMDPKQVQ
jgi:predicted lactoylglutathione lyase